MTDRDPTNPAALVPLVAAVLAAGRADDATPEAQEAAAAALFDELLAQGCLTPEEHAEAYLDDDTAEQCCVVRVVGFGWLVVSGVTGETDAYDEATAC